VAVDGAGNVYVADVQNHTIRKITPAGVVTTLAGRAGQRGSADGTGSAARFFYPSGVAVDGAGNVYVADLYNHTIRKITPAGVVTTLAGSAGQRSSEDGTGSAARFHYPSGVAVDGAGNVYVADERNNKIRKGVPISGWDAGYQDYGNGWRGLGWFGDYFPLAGDWFWHNRHGYWYAWPQSTPSSVFFYSFDKG
jgi:hypothetical protein